MLDALLSKKSVDLMTEEWIDRYASLQDVSIGLATIMNRTTVREKIDPDVVMKGLSITISKHQHALLKMEALRQQKSIRALLKCWIEENVKDWYYEPVGEHQEWHDRIAA